MKSILLDIGVAFVAILLLLVCTWFMGRKKTQNETFSSPSTGTGRVTEENIPADNETLEIETDSAPETDSASYQQVTVKLAEKETDEILSTKKVVETDETVPVEVIPAVEGKYLDVPMSAELQEYARSVSEEYGIPFELTMAVIYVESGFDAAAISSTGDYGLMQVSYINHGWLSDELGVTDFLNPYDNIRAGVHVLAEKIRESGGDFTTALMRYNRGDAVALQQMAQGIFSTAYTNKVLSKYYEYIREG